MGNYLHFPPVYYLLLTIYYELILAIEVLYFLSMLLLSIVVT